MRNLLILLIPALLLSSCNPDRIDTKIDAQGITIQSSPVWRSSVSENDKYIANDIGQAIVTDKGVLFPKGTALPSNPQYSRSYIVLKDKETGQDLWSWNDFLTDFERFHLYRSWQDDVNEVLLHLSSNRGYGIDMKTGKTIWKTTYSDRWAGVPAGTGKGFYYNTLNPKEYYEKAISKPNLCVGNLRTGVIEPLLTPIYSGSIGQEGGGYKQFFTGINGIRLLTLNGEEHLLFDYFDSTHPTINWLTPRISLYNLTQKKFVYEGLAMKEAGYLLAVNGHLQVNNGKVYDAMARYTVCHDLMTGKQLWERAFGSLCDYQLAFDNKLLTYISDGNLYCLDANTGQTLWRQECVVGSNFAHLNGVVYYTANRELRASDAQTGKVSWRIESPDWRKNDNARFKGFVAVVPGKGGQKGRVYAHTGLNAYCYEAIR